jgi:hypothetical protein
VAPGTPHDPNKRNHIFANPDHNLDALVRHYGGEDEAFRAIANAVDEGWQAGKLSTDALGRYKQVFDVGGYPVMVVGRIVNGLVRIGAAWIPRHPWGWSVELAQLRRAPTRLVDAVFETPWTQETTDA